MPLLLAGQTQDQSREKKDFFENRIRPLLAQSCFACHTNSQMGGLRLDSRADILKGGASGPALVPGDPDKSLLVNSIREGKMPKSGHLQDQQIADLVKWVKDGAYWPDPLPAERAALYHHRQAARVLVLPAFAASAAASR